MAFWKVAGFTQPSPIESILDKEEFTLEELLDEDDIIQECKSLNGRLITFLRERKTVEQLLRYLIEPPNDPDDPKKQYRYPFTACEVFCCEVEAVFNTLLEDEELLQLLFSLLEQEPPLSCKSAGYFGRVVGQLLLRKTNEMMQYLSNNEAILEKLIKHVDTTSIADIIKRLVGADDHSSMIFLPMHTQWLSETPLIDMLLERLAPQYSTHVQSNAADILTAIAHTQPSALATQLMQQQSIAALFSRALAPDSRVLVTALDVCAALLEPRRAQQEPSPDGASPMASTAGGNSQSYTEAVTGMLQYLPQLMEHMKEPQGDAAEAQQETPYGILAPPLGRARLRIVELLAALLRVGDDSVDAAIIGAGALPLVQQLFVAYPFNNLLHHQMYALLFAALQRSNAALVEYVFGECALVSWLANIPKEVNPKPRPGFEGRAPLRAGYLGHITRLGQVLQEFAAQQQDIAAVLKDNSEWESFVQQDLMPRLEIEDITHWQCGRPINAEGGELDSDGDEFQNGMDALEQIQGVPPGMYHRYGVLDDMDDDEDEASDHVGDFTNSGPYNADMLVAGMAGLGMDDSEAVQPHAVPSLGASGSGAAEATGADGGASISNWSLLAHPGTSSSAVDIPGERSMEDDAVLLADDDEMGALTASALQSSPPVGSPSPVGPSAPTPMDDSEMVMVEEVDAAVSTSPQPAAQPDVAPATAPNIPSESPASALHVHQQDSIPASAEVPAADQKTAAMANPFVAAAGGSSVSEPSTADAGMSQATVAAAAEMDQHNGVVDPAVDSRQDVCVRDRNYWPGLSHPVQVADEVV